ncbi:hypothetical protein ACVXG8_09855 [Escherichia coli]
MIFNGEMVRAILDGKKTQTRRIMKVQPSDGFHPTHNGYDLDLNAHWYTPGVMIKTDTCNLQRSAFGVADENEGYTCPFGAVGDRIWVRETWAEAGAGAPDLKLYRADYPEHVPTHYENVPLADEIRWTPSIHMPRWASRLTLEIPECELSDCRPLPLGISVRKSAAVFTTSALLLMAFRCGKNCGSPSTAKKTGRPTPGSG